MLNPYMTVGGCVDREVLSIESFLNFKYFKCFLFNLVFSFESEYRYFSISDISE